MTRCAARARLHQFPRGSRAPRPAAPREVETPRRARPRLQSARACTELVPGPGLEMTPPCAAAELSSEATFYLRGKQRPTCMMVQFIYLFIYLYLSDNCLDDNTRYPFFAAFMAFFDFKT